jgi:hypothetical protein
MLAAFRHSKEPQSDTPLSSATDHALKQSDTPPECGCQARFHEVGRAVKTAL